MKKAILGVLFASAMLASCSSDEPIVNGEDNSLAEQRYISVNIVTTPTSSARSRAAGNQTTGDPNNSATYEEGLEAENKVNSIRFYFFAENGAAANVKNNGDGSYSNYIDWTEDINIKDENDMPNVEKIVSATIVINTKAGDKTPAYMIAVVNGTREKGLAYDIIEGDNNCIYSVAKNYMNQTDAFTMTNATFKDAAGKEVKAVSVADKMFSTTGEALNNPVKIYVEREVAKVRLNSSLTETSAGSGIYATSTADKTQEVTLNNKKETIYVKLLGWNTTAVADKSLSIKDINPTWADNLFGEGNPWNWAEYHRCFWGINASGVNYLYGKFNATDATNPFTAKAKTKFDKSQWVYVNENASDNATGASPAKPTQVIIAAQLVDATGNPLEFAEYGTTRCSIADLLNIYANNCGLYKKDPANTNHLIKAEPSDLVIKTATEMGKGGIENSGRYKVYVQLSDAAKTTKWYPNNSEGQTKDLGEPAANAKLLALGSAKVWKEGYTYYYFDIRHLGGMKGVVRNHIYDSRVTKLTGLGTPVYNPDEVIYPEHPDDDKDTYIAAEINVLSWRVVSNDEELKW